MIGQWVLDAACRQLRAWQDAGIAPGLVGVNISALHFKGSAELDREVAACLEKWGIAPDMIEIELTESVLMEITQQHNDRFERLRQLGVRIAIDDFGTGYSSLSYLANYPINRVKIAQELVFAVATAPRSAAVVRAAIRLADELGIDLIAEGIESEGQEAISAVRGLRVWPGLLLQPAGQCEACIRAFALWEDRAAAKVAAARGELGRIAARMPGFALAVLQGTLAARCHLPLMLRRVRRFTACCVTTGRATRCGRYLTCRSRN